MPDRISTYNPTAKNRAAADQTLENGNVSNLLRGELRQARRRLAPSPPATSATIVHANIVSAGRGGLTSGIPTPRRSRASSHPAPPGRTAGIPARSVGAPATPAATAPLRSSPCAAVRRTTCYRCREPLDESQITWTDFPGEQADDQTQTTHWHPYCLIGLVAEDVLRLIPEKDAPKDENVAATIFNRFYGGAEGSTGKKWFDWIRGSSVGW
ncbi:uncharacterized protein BP01DRAFT_353977 [Aspergillus saccharolyticus JOP 1030-1]|uniref:PARP-type domain-containing protein n=1 Tax=Aspergillus saccharolyticus JOP 1030-1 TaxID=1450539 RepID=A0A319A8W7_9EURO|nr:hypothetical protein BP01DRAFT_353977 [Aspergillus saccharolyticus JOP 1030-1]PYH48128.1 hypothetical protein BP01DRAFT_353977 [Aspergillus saccharolyticus JOP 1030-1]